MLKKKAKIIGETLFDLFKKSPKGSGQAYQPLKGFTDAEAMKIRGYQREFSGNLSASLLQALLAGVVLNTVLRQIPRTAEVSRDVSKLKQKLGDAPKSDKSKDIDLEELGVKSAAEDGIQPMGPHNVPFGVFPRGAANALYLLTFPAGILGVNLAEKLGDRIRARKVKKLKNKLRDEVDTLLGDELQALRKNAELCAFDSFMDNTFELTKTAREHIENKITGAFKNWADLIGSRALGGVNTVLAAGVLTALLGGYYGGRQFMRSRAKSRGLDEKTLRRLFTRMTRLQSPIDRDITENPVRGMDFESFRGMLSDVGADSAIALSTGVDSDEDLDQVKKAMYDELVKPGNEFMFKSAEAGKEDILETRYNIGKALEPAFKHFTGDKPDVLAGYRGLVGAMDPFVKQWYTDPKAEPTMGDIMGRFGKYYTGAENVIPEAMRGMKYKDVQDFFINPPDFKNNPMDARVATFAPVLQAAQNSDYQKTFKDTLGRLGWQSKAYQGLYGLRSFFQNLGGLLAPVWNKTRGLFGGGQQAQQGAPVSQVNQSQAAVYNPSKPTRNYSADAGLTGSISGGKYTPPNQFQLAGNAGTGELTRLEGK